MLADPMFVDTSLYFVFSNLSDMPIKKLALKILARKPHEDVIGAAIVVSKTFCEVIERARVITEVKILSDLTVSALPQCCRNGS